MGLLFDHGRFRASNKPRSAVGFADVVKLVSGHWVPTDSAASDRWIQNECEWQNRSSVFQSNEVIDVYRTPWADLRRTQRIGLD
jgi:hypothetical protein